MNKKVRIAIRVLLGVILVVGLLLGLLMVPPVQNYLGRAISHKISQNIPQEISIDTFTVRPSGRVHMAGVLLKDHHDDTLAYIPAVDARIRLSSIFSSRISLGYVLLTSPDVHIFGCYTIGTHIYVHSELFQSNSHRGYSRDIFYIKQATVFSYTYATYI